MIRITRINLETNLVLFSHFFENLSFNLVIFTYKNPSVAIFHKM